MRRRGDGQAELADDDLGGHRLDPSMIEIEHAHSGVVHDIRGEADRDGEGAGHVDADVLMGQGSLEGDVDGAGRKVEKGVSLDEGPHEGSSAMVALDGFAAAYPSIDDEDFVRGASPVEFGEEEDGGEDEDQEADEGSA